MWIVLVLDQHDVVRLEIAMHDARLMGSLQGVGDLDEDVLDAPAVQGLGSQRTGEALTLEQIHHDVEGAVGQLAEVRHLTDVPAPHRVGGLCFADEPLKDFFGPLDVGSQHLHRELFANDHVTAGIDGAHPASSHDALDAISPVHDLADQILGTSIGTGVQMDQCDAIVGTALVLVHVLLGARRTDLHELIMPDSDSCDPYLLLLGLLKRGPRSLQPSAAGVRIPGWSGRSRGSDAPATQRYRVADGDPAQQLVGGRSSIQGGTQLVDIVRFPEESAAAVIYKRPQRDLVLVAIDRASFIAVCRLAPAPAAAFALAAHRAVDDGDHDRLGAGHLDDPGQCRWHRWMGPIVWVCRIGRGQLATQRLRHRRRSIADPRQPAVQALHDIGADGCGASYPSAAGRHLMRIEAADGCGEQGRCNARVGIDRGIQSAEARRAAQTQ